MYNNFNERPETSVGADVSRTPPMYRPWMAFSNIPIYLFITTIRLNTSQDFIKF